MTHSHSPCQQPARAEGSSSKQHSTRVRQEAYLEGGDADAVHQVWFVGLQQGDEGQELVLAVHLVLAI